MIVKKQDAKKKEFKGVSFDVLAIGEKSMITKMYYRVGDHVPFHSHYNEQSGYVISGKIRLRFGEYDEILQAGDSYSIPGNTMHSIDALKESMVLDFFVPPRADYL